MSGPSDTRRDAIVASWSEKFGVTSVLERAIGAGASPACVGLARGGASVTCVVDDEATAGVFRAAYGPSAAVRAASDARAMPKCDLVVVHGAAPGAGGDWGAPLAALIKNASKLAVVVAPNPAAASSRVRALFDRAASRGAAWGATEAMASVLWGLGRVRDHVWLETSPLADRATRFTRALSRSHMFVVDVTPRSPQARRKLRLSTHAED